MNFFRRYYVAAVLFFVWFVSVLLTWRIVENPYWDFADLLYSSERLGMGQTIYRDFQTPYPPLIFWLYGSVMKFFPGSYAAVSVVSILSALLFLIGNYMICRLIHGRSDSLKIAICIYLTAFTVSSVIGENFVSLGFSFVGITLLVWFAWFASRFFYSRPPSLFLCFFGGGLAGLCLLSKHERIAGVFGILGFLVFVSLFWKRNRAYLSGILLLLLGMLMVASGGYIYAIVSSGWFYVFSSLTQFGGIGNSAARNIPVLTDLGSQLVLLALHFGLIMAVIIWIMAGRSGDADRKIKMTALKYLFGALAIGVSLLALESFRVIAVAKQMDFGSIQYLSRTMLALSFYSIHDVHLAQSVINYFGGIIFGNILPMISVIIWLLVTLIFLRIRQSGKNWLVPPRKWFFSMMLLWGAFCLQSRFIMRQSEIGALSMVFPVFIFYAERLPFILLCIKPRLSLWRSLKQCYLFVFLVIMFLTSLVVYSYEFKDVWVNPIKVKSDKGIIRLPDLPMNRAFARLTSYLRDNRLTCFKIVVVPNAGIQYWVGGQLSPFAWGGGIQPEFYRAPWRDNLMKELKRNDCIFIELCRQEVSIQANISAEEWSWIDGPLYRLERWKEAFPQIWNHIQSNTVQIAEFGPTNEPYFRVYAPEFKNRIQHGE